MNSIKIVEMMTSLLKDKNLGEKVVKKVARSLTKLFDGASSISIDDTSEKQIYFVAPRNAFDSTVLELTQFNYHILSSLMEAKRGIKLQSLGIEDEMLSLYRNYFDNKAQGALNVH